MLEKKMSKFAQERANKAKLLNKEKTSQNEDSFPKIIIGNVVERTEGTTAEQNAIANVSFDDSEGFPKPKRIDKKVFFCPNCAK